MVALILKNLVAFCRVFGFRWKVTEEPNRLMRHFTRTSTGLDTASAGLDFDP